MGFNNSVKRRATWLLNFLFSAYYFYDKSCVLLLQQCTRLPSLLFRSNNYDSLVYRYYYALVWLRLEGELRFRVRGDFYFWLLKRVRYYSLMDNDLLILLYLAFIFSFGNRILFRPRLLRVLKPYISSSKRKYYTIATFWARAGWRTPVFYAAAAHYTHNCTSCLLPTTIPLYISSYKRLFGYYISQFGGGSFFYLYFICVVLFIDACLTDDEPLWEPIEWSLLQTWLLFLFLFAWIAENLIVSRYGSYTGRDKRVWLGWYKTFWLLEIYYVINFGAAVVFVIVPFYYEVTYSLSYVFSWWQWYSRLFFFKFISLYSLVIVLAYVLQLNVRWFFWKKNLFIILLINIFISYLLYTHFMMSFFSYFTDPLWYQKTRTVDYVQLSHEPSRWGWGPAKKDHFTYHNVKTVFWFKGDGPYASAFLIMQIVIFLFLFFLYLYWVVLFRRVYSTGEVPQTLTTYSVSALKQFFYIFLYFYIFIFLSYGSHYIRYPLEFLWVVNSKYWFSNLLLIIYQYPTVCL